MVRHPNYTNNQLIDRTRIEAEWAGSLNGAAVAERQASRTHRPAILIIGGFGESIPYRCSGLISIAAIGKGAAITPRASQVAVVIQASAGVGHAGRPRAANARIIIVGKRRHPQLDNRIGLLITGRVDQGAVGAEFLRAQRAAEVVHAKDGYLIAIGVHPLRARTARLPVQCIFIIDIH